MTTAIEIDRAEASDSRGDDSRLVDAIARRDQTALRHAYDLYAAKVNGIALGILKDPHLAADITQDIFLRLWNRHARYDATRGSLAAFLKVDAHGRSIDLLRSRKAAMQREITDHAKQSSTESAGTEELAMTEITSSTVRSALLGLPPEQRTPIAMAYFNGYSYREVSDTLGIPEGTIKSRIRAGMRRLQLALGAEVAA